MNYAFFSVWLALGFSGWIIACSGLSALQRYENHSGLSVLGTTLHITPWSHHRLTNLRNANRSSLLPGCLALSHSRYCLTDRKCHIFHILLRLVCVSTPFDTGQQQEYDLR